MNGGDLICKEMTLIHRNHSLQKPVAILSEVFSIANVE